jgi:hypothetical protein
MRKIRCIVTKGTQKPRERWFILNALKGNIAALEKTYGGTIEVADPSLTEEEAEAIRHNFPYVAGKKSERVNPLLADSVDALGEIQEVEGDPLTNTEGEPDPDIEVVDDPVIYDGGEKVAYAESEEDALRAMLDNAGVKHGRVKKIEKLREMVAELK